MIGIDLGTTNSACAHATATGLEIVPNKRGDRLTPSVISFDGRSREAAVGKQAANQAVQYPDRTVFSVKRFMGTDEEILLGDEGRESAFTPEELSALILKKLAEDATVELGQPVEQAVITVPAYFNDRQRQATKHAGEIAGLSVERILNEPTAACLAYGLHSDTDRTVLVYDLGGGTFDSSLIEIGSGVFEVKATNGDTQLGGDDWDGRIVDWLETQVQTRDGTGFEDGTTTERVFEAAKQAKHELTNRKQTTIRLPFLELGNATCNVEETLTRSQFEELTSDLTEETIYLCEELLEMAGYTSASIDAILLVGGSTRMPHVRDRVSEYFGIKPSLHVNPDEAVALGAAAQAAILDDDLLPVPSNGSGAVERKRESGNLPTRDPGDIVLLTVTPQSLGLEAVDANTNKNFYSVLIDRNESIPASETKEYTTVEGDQRYVYFPVYQGDGPLAENEQLDEFELGPIPPRPKGEPNIEVTFTIDQDGLLQVSAEDIEHNIGEEIAIESVFGLSQPEITEMTKNLPAVD